MRRTLYSLLTLCFGLCLGAGSLQAQDETPSLFEIARDNGGFNTLTQAIRVAGLEETLSGTDSLTIYAPTDDAFERLPAGALTALLADSAALRDLLLYHVRVGAQPRQTSPIGLSFVNTINGNSMQLFRLDGDINDIEGDSITVNGSIGLDNPDVYASNGIFNAVRTVLMPPSVVDIAVNSPVHGTLVSALTQADLVGTLSGDGPFTVFAPTDAAFDVLPDGALAAVLGDSATLASVLSYHVVAGEFAAADFMDGDFLTTLQGDSLEVTVNDMGVYVDSVLVQIADINATNGIVHVIGEVLMPAVMPDDTTAAFNSVFDVIADSDIHETLEAAIIAADLEEALDDSTAMFTVFAPNDDAFDALPAGTVDTLLANTDDLANILTYHVVAGTFTAADLMDGMRLATLQGDSLTVVINETGIYVDSVLVEVADILADNGVVHSIGAVLMPAMMPGDTTDGGENEFNSVFDVIAESEIHTTLEAAINAAGLAEALDDSTGTFTVFAPSDSAFAKLPAGTVDTLLANPEDLATILRYHVVVGSFMAADFMDGMRVATLQGDSLTVTINDTGIYVDSVLVEFADLAADNGIVHSIGSVLMPAMMPTDTTDGGDSTNSVFDVIANSDVHETLESALRATGLVGALEDLSDTLTVFAPDDAAFAAAFGDDLAAAIADTASLRQTLLYHVLGFGAAAGDIPEGLNFFPTSTGESVQVEREGATVTLNAGPTVTTADIRADNGIVHIINGVLSRPSIVDIVVNSPVHSTLETVLGSADLVTALSGDGPFTVFAPTNEAFEAINADTLATILDDPTGQLATLLRYHVVAGLFRADSLVDGQKLVTLQGDSLSVEVDENSITSVNGVPVVIADITGTNGVVHAINSVLIPDMFFSGTVQPAAEAGIKVFPTLSRGNVRIDMPRDIQLQSIQVVSLQGQSTTIIPTENRIDLTRMPVGTYFLLLNTNSGQYSSRVMLAR